VNQDIEKYYRILLARESERLAVEGQAAVQKLEIVLGRTGKSGSGVFELGLLGVFCDWNVKRPTLAILECFEAACTALKVEPTQSDYDEIQKIAEELLERGDEGARRWAGDRAARKGIPGDYASPVQQVVGRTRSELRRIVELRKIEVTSRSRLRIPENRDAVLSRISQVNSHSKRVLGYRLFVTTEHRVLVDLGRTPSSEEELATCVQALGIFLAQIDQERLSDELSAAGRAVPPGSMNRLGEVLKLRGIRGDSAIQTLRDLARLRSLYPAHPDSTDAIAAAERLGIPRNPSSTVDTWCCVLDILVRALDELCVALVGAK